MPRLRLQDRRLLGTLMMQDRPSIPVEFVEFLPDLIQPEEYTCDPDGRRVRIQIRMTEDGVDLLSDAMTPRVLEALLQTLEPKVVQQMLCG